MSTITLRVAEVEERLQLLRRRLNHFRAQHFAYLGGSGVALITALLIVAGLQASPQAFRTTLWLSIAVALACLGGVLWLLARRWLDVATAARLADRQSGLADRLSTLISLRSRPQTSRLAPLLATQALDLGERWRPERILPRRVPRSIFMFAASLLLLAVTALLQREGGDGLLSGPEEKKPEQLGGESPLQVPQRHAPEARGDRSQETADGLGPQTGRGGDLPPGTAPEGGAYDGSIPIEGAQLNELPDRLQDAIRRAFNAEPLDSPRRVGGNAEEPGSPGRRGEGRERSGEGKDAERGTLPAKGERETRGEAAEQSAQEPRASRDNKGQPERAGQRRDTGAAPGERSGSSPSAGDGSGSVPPIGSIADLGKAGAAATFKLTITSFLAAVESQGLPQRDLSAGPAPTGAGVGGQLSDRQLNDDVLRKSEIPPQYEDVVRRAYSVGK